MFCRTGPVVVGLLLLFPATVFAQWGKMAPLTSPNGGCASLKFFDDKVGFAYCDSKIFATTDGATWVDKGDARPTFPIASGAAVFLDLNTVLLGGSTLDPSTSFMQKSVDGGMTWMAKPLPGAPKVVTTTAAVFFDAQNGIAFGITQTGAGRAVLASSADAGDTWTLVALPFIDAAATQSKVVAAAMLDGNTFVVSAYQKVGATTTTFLQRSTDRGATWTAVTAPAFGVHALAFPDATHGFGMVGGGPEAGLWASQDGGITWAKTSWVVGSLGAGNVIGMTWKDAMNGLLFATDGIMRSTDGGNTVTRETLPADWLPNDPIVNGVEWPGPAAYAFSTAGTKEILKNPTAGGTSTPIDAGATTGMGGAAGAGDQGGATGAAGATGIGGAAGVPPKTGGGGGCAVGGRGERSALALAAVLLLMIFGGHRREAGLPRTRRWGRY